MGRMGGAEESPFDRIIVTAAAPIFLRYWLNSLSRSSVLVIPVGSRYSQSLCKITKKGDKIEKEEYTPCVFCSVDWEVWLE